MRTNSIPSKLLKYLRLFGNGMPNKFARVCYGAIFFFFSFLSLSTSFTFTSKIHTNCTIKTTTNVRMETKLSRIWRVYSVITQSHIVQFPSSHSRMAAMELRAKMLERDGVKRTVNQRLNNGMDEKCGFVRFKVISIFDPFFSSLFYWMIFHIFGTVSTGKFSLNKFLFRYNTHFDRNWFNRMRII